MPIVAVFGRLGIRSAEDAAIVLFAYACMVGGGVVLLATNRRSCGGGGSPAGPPLVALIAAFVP